MRYGIESNMFYYVVYPRVAFVLKSLSSTHTRDVKTLIYDFSYMYIVIEDNQIWSFMLSVFPLSYKLSTSVSSV